MRQDLFSIGEFSRMCRLSVKALRLYDEQGILRPAYTDPQSGYRYYSSAQLAEANLVRLLRSLDLPLDDIRVYLRERDAAARGAILEEHRGRTEARLKQYESIILSIDGLSRSKGEEMERVVEVKELSDQPVLSIRMKTALSRIGEDIGASYGAIFGYVGRVGAMPAGPPFTLYYDEEMKEDDVDMEVGAPVDRVYPGEGEVKGRVLPGGKFLSTMHLGPYDTVGSAYEALITYAKENGMEPTAPSREVYLVGPGQEGVAPADYRTEVLMPVK